MSEPVFPSSCHTCFVTWGFVWVSHNKTAVCTEQPSHRSERCLSFFSWRREMFHGCERTQSSSTCSRCLSFQQYDLFQTLWRTIDKSPYKSDYNIVCAWTLTLCLLSEPERGGLPPGPVLGGRSHGGLLLHGPAVVRCRHRDFHRSHWQSEDGNGDLGARRAAQVPGCEVSPSDWLMISYKKKIWWWDDREYCYKLEYENPVRLSESY